MTANTPESGEEAAVYRQTYQQRYYQEHREEHREKRNAQSRKYHQEHREEAAAYQQRYLEEKTKASCAAILRQHHEVMKEDPERLTTIFIADLVGCDCPRIRNGVPP